MGKRPRLTRISEEKNSSGSPGYPYYVSSDDAVSKDEPVVNSSTPAKEEIAPEEILPETEENSIELPPSDEYTITKEDIAALGADGLSMDGGDDELLAHRVAPIDFTGNDLDVPGAELDDESEAVGSEDEENNSYSLGGDDHNDLEESKP